LIDREKESIVSSIFKPADQIVRPFVKVALDGYQGSGKSETASRIVAGVVHDFNVEGPVFLIDNEKSAKFLNPLMRSLGVKQIEVVESDSLAVVRDGIKEVEARNGILLIDGLSKVSNRMESDFLATVGRTNKKTIEIQDRPILNAAWRDNFEEPFVRANCHIVFTGRAAVDWGNGVEEDPITGKEKRTFFAKGVKMAGHKETLYAPDYAIYMERIEHLTNDSPLKREKEVWREATIIKDRSRILDGKTFRNPAYDDLAPMFRFLLSAPAGVPNELSGDSSTVFGQPEGNVTAWVRRKEVALEEIEGLLTSAFPGQKAEEKKAKVDALRDVYGTTSWTAIKGMKPDEIEAGLNPLRSWIATRTAVAEREAVNA
jgi:hypothetical protein